MIFLKFDLLLKSFRLTLPNGFMSEGNKQAPISSGWWYEFSLEFFIYFIFVSVYSLLLAVMSHTCPCSLGSKGLPPSSSSSSSSPPRTPPPSLSPVFEPQSQRVITTSQDLILFVCVCVCFECVCISFEQKVEL